MVRRYLETRFQIADRTDADFLQNPNNWKITLAILDAGSQGITSGELAEKLNISYKIVADTARRLSQMKWITSEPPKRTLGRPKADEKRDFRKPAKLHMWNLLRSFEPVVEADFAERCSEVFDKHERDFKPFITALGQVISEIKSSYQMIVPIHECGWSHEGYEFVRGILYTLLDWLEEKAEFQDILQKHELATKKAFVE